MDSQSSAALFSTSIVTPTRVSHKRRRSAMTSPAQRQEPANCSFSAAESCCTTSGESSGDESEATAFELEEQEEQEEQVQEAKRRRRADLDGIKKSVRQMEAQVVNASAQLRDLAAMVAQVVARRQQQQQLQLQLA